MDCIFLNAASKLVVFVELTVKKTVIAMAALAACVGFTGCASRYADTPAPTRFANEDQQKLQAARHWQLIAEHFAGQLAAGLNGKLAGRALYVPQPGGEQLFVEGFRELLITALVERGVPIAVSESGAVVADVRYNAYRFRPERLASTYYYGEATTLAAGLWAVSSVLVGNLSSATGVEAGTKLVTAALGVDGFGWLKNEAFGNARFASGPVPQSEILLTVSVADGGRIVSRYSNIYYTADADADLYWTRSGGGATLKLVGDCGSEVPKCAR